MNKKMHDRIAKALKAAAKKYKLSPKVEKIIMRDLEKDYFLPQLSLRENFAVVFKTGRDECEADSAVSLYLEIGPRDWEWNKEDGDLIGCGTLL
jgi:hypothetical protein